MCRNVEAKQGRSEAESYDGSVALWHEMLGVFLWWPAKHFTWSKSEIFYLILSALPCFDAEVMAQGHFRDSDKLN